MKASFLLCQCTNLKGEEKTLPAAPASARVNRADREAQRSRQLDVLLKSVLGLPSELMQQGWQASRSLPCDILRKSWLGQTCKIKQGHLFLLSRISGICGPRAQAVN